MFLKLFCVNSKVLQSVIKCLCWPVLLQDIASLFGFGVVDRSRYFASCKGIVSNFL